MSDEIVGMSHQHLLKRDMTDAHKKLIRDEIDRQIRSLNWRWGWVGCGTIVTGLYVFVCLLGAIQSLREVQPNEIPWVSVAVSFVALIGLLYSEKLFRAELSRLAQEKAKHW